MPSLARVIRNDLFNNTEQTLLLVSNYHSYMSNAFSSLSILYVGDWKKSLNLEVKILWLTLNKNMENDEQRDSKMTKPLEILIKLRANIFGICLFLIGLFMISWTERS